MRTTSPSFGRLGQHEAVIVKAFVAPHTYNLDLRVLERRTVMDSTILGGERP